MPTVACIGELMQTPKRQNPQELSLGEIFDVCGLKDPRENGIYVIKIRNKPSVKQIFLSEAQKITGQLTRREGVFPAYGRDEVSLETQPIREGTELHGLITREFKRAFPDKTCDFV